MSGLRVVVVGASLAGIRAAQALREVGFGGALDLVSAEPHFPPYDRPPLSKQVLQSQWTLEKARLRLPENLAATVHRGRRAVALDLTERTVRLTDASVLCYDGLVIATGARARQLPAFAELAGVHVLRTVEHCLALREELERARRVVIVGAGFIGAEVAASCRALGLEVVLVDVFAEPMQRVLGAEMGSVLRELHGRHGVEFALGASIAEVSQRRGRFAGLRFADGTRVDGDAVIVAVGAEPETEWLVSSGLTVDDGVRCDEACFALGAEAVVAAGDVARWRHPVLGEDVRIEHWTNAVAQAQCAARNLSARLAGHDEVEAYAALPYYWSDQYDWKLQFVGRPGPDVTVTEGSVEDGRFMAEYRSGDQLRGALCVNLPARIPVARRRVLDAYPLALKP